MDFDEALLIRLYSEQDRSVDDLPYTEDMTRIANRYNIRATPKSARDLYLKLQNLRKAGKLIRKDR